MIPGIRVGLGYDIHRLEADASPAAGVVLAGVRVPCPWRLVAHSDGDAALHALVDAILGAAGAGDIGERFPDSDVRHLGRDSADFVAAVLALPELAAWQIVNCDINIIAQAPRLLDHKPAMRARVAALLGIPAGHVGVKARSKEGLDATGERRAIEAQAVVLLAQR